MANQNINGLQFYQEHPAFRPKREGRVKRIIVELFFKIVCNFWRTQASYFFSTTLSTETQNLEENAAGRLEVRGCHGQQIVSELKHRRTIGNSTMLEYIETVLIPDYDEIFGFANNFLFSVCNTELPDCDKNLIFVPVVLKSFIREHIVAIVFDRTENRVELYDSKGLVALDRNNYVRNREQLMLIEVIQLVVQKYGNNETTIWENTKKHQKDSHNCGIFVLDYIIRRLNGESAEDIADHGLKFSKVNNSRRDELLRDYYEHLPEPETRIEYGGLEQLFD